MWLPWLGSFLRPSLALPVSRRFVSQQHVCSGVSIYTALSMRLLVGIIILVLKLGHFVADRVDLHASRSKDAAGGLNPAPRADLVPSCCASCQGLESGWVPLAPPSNSEFTC